MFFIKMVIAVSRIIKIFHAVILPADMRITALALYPVASIIANNVNRAFWTFACSLFEKVSNILCICCLVDCASYSKMIFYCTFWAICLLAFVAGIFGEFRRMHRAAIFVDTEVNFFKVFLDIIIQCHTLHFIELFFV